MRPRRDLTGLRFGMIHVIGPGPDWVKNGSTVARWECKCSCGSTKLIMGLHLKSGMIVSCGCRKSALAKRIFTSHGESHSKSPNGQAYSSWKAMKTRCSNPNQPGWKNYGGRGIKVCHEWVNSFESFLRYVGPRPRPEMTLDRFPDNDGDYEPGNVRWATRKQQASNSRRWPQNEK